jgi:hypothetical protein
LGEVLEYNGEDLGSVLLSILSYAEELKNPTLSAGAVYAAQVALLEVPDANLTPSLLRAARWCRNRQEVTKDIAFERQGDEGIS